MQERARDKNGTLISKICEVSWTADNLVRALLSLSPHRRLSLLDSCGAHNPSARFLIAGFDPFEIIEARGQQICTLRRGETSERVTKGEVLDVLDERLEQYRAQPLPSENLPATGACIATFSYDLVRHLDHLRLTSPFFVSDEPDVVLAFYDTLIIHDYLSGTTRIVCVGDPQRIAETTEALAEALVYAIENCNEFQPSTLSVTSNLTRDEYLTVVDKFKEHIAAGDIYQANLTQQFSCRLSMKSRSEDVFLSLRRNHPAPFAAYIRRGDDVVISASPERFLSVNARGDERYVDAWPIKGTRSRGHNKEDDARQRADLLMSEKDRAENIMIVDLLRNDLGRVCRYGSVEVTELCALEEHPTLFHLVSKVRGVLRVGVTAGDLLRAAFPCGSITGAPKIRAMEIIAENEIDPRGLSMGAVGYFSFDGSLDLNVAIRTMVIRDRVARFNVGGGIVADSSPSLEYEESLIKALALFNALGVET